MRRAGLWIVGVVIVASAAAFFLAQRPGTAEPVPLPAVSAALQDRVTASGRLEPKGGVVSVAGPSDPVVVVAKLLVEENDQVEQGDVVAYLDRVSLLRAALDEARAELQNAETQFARHDRMFGERVISDAARDEWSRRAKVARASVRRAQADIERATVRAPITGRVIAVHTRAGERVGDQGLLEIGKTDEMYAIAEVFETDIGRVRVGQAASVTSPVFGEPLAGTVEKIGLKVGKADVLGTDPAARTDARVVEVDIRLEDGTAVAGLTNLQVEVEIGAR